MYNRYGKKPNNKRKSKMKPAADAAPPSRSFFTKLKHPSDFSKPQLLVFVLAFALIGYLLVKAFAAAPLVATLQAEQMISSGANNSSGFSTGLTNGMTVSAPYIWTFNPGVPTTAGYFWDNNKLLAKINGPGPYAFRLSSGLLSSGTHQLGHGWDTTSGVHQTPPSSYNVTIKNTGNTGFATSLTSGTTIHPPYIWAFDPGVNTTAGYFWDNNTLITKINGSRPYIYVIQPGALSTGTHQLGHGWDLASDGTHHTPQSSYTVTIGSPASTSSNYSVINDPTASGGQAVKFGAGVTLTGSVNLASSVTSLTVMTHGEQCSGSWPQMKVTVDGQSLVNTTVSATSWTANTANVTLNSGIHSLAITNASSGSCLPNLYADVTNFFGPNVVTLPPTVALSASPTSVASGQSSTITWASTNATACTASGAWSGSEPTSGSISSGALNQNSTYSLTCTGSGGTATASTTVTVSAAVSSYDSAISYTKSRPAFTPTRTVNVSDATSLKNAVSNLHPGDLVRATADFTVSSSTTNGFVIANRLSAPAVIDLTGHTVKFAYTGAQQFFAVWVKNAQNVRIYGGDLTDPGGSTCLGITASQHVTWWGFKSHDCGGNGLSMFTSKPGYSFAGPVEYDDIQGEAWHTGLHPAWDPHVEKCSGIHGANLADGNYFSFDNNRVALYHHDSACSGGGIEFGSSQSTNIPDHNTIYLKCVSLTFISTIQTGGNCYQTWGYGNKNNDIKYLEANNLTGHPYWAGGLYNKSGAGATYLTTDTVDYARALNVRQNSKYANDANYDKRGGTVFKNVSPLP
jgi:hypothetical protein